MSGRFETFEYVSHGAEDTLRLAFAVGKGLEAGDIVLLYGDLGAGKTTFVQGLCRGAGMAEGMYARSPTFTLMNEYKGRRPIRHVDMYRVDTLEEYETIGIFDPAFDGIMAVEWADKLPAGYEPEAAVRIWLTEEAVDVRKISIKAPSRMAVFVMSIITDR